MGETGENPPLTAAQKAAREGVGVVVNTIGANPDSISKNPDGSLIGVGSAFVVDKDGNLKGITPISLSPVSGGRLPSDVAAEQYQRGKVKELARRAVLDAQSRSGRS